MRRFVKIVDGVVDAGHYSYWISLSMKSINYYLRR
jgi:hypothetical protein